MKIHEFQAKEILRKAGVPVPRGIVAHTADEAAAAFKELGGKLAVVKAQIHAGGRGKGTLKTNPAQHGVELVKSAADAAKVAGNLLGQPLVTIQTGPSGQTVRQVLVEEGCDIARELYLGIVVDRAAAGPVLMVSAQGGMNIEEVAAHTPELIFRERFHPDTGLLSYQARKLAARLGLKGASVASAEKFIKGLCRVFVQQDCSLAEINPLVVTGAGELLALDAKMTFDDNALFRHKDLAELRDLAEEEPMEVRAGQAGLSFVKLEGNIGCLVNGAGLAMSTMDIIKHFGGNPANFLDVGGGATREQVVAAFKIILGDPKVNGILVNIFGGIMDCDVIANGIVEAVREVGLKLPLVVRLEGNNSVAGKATLAKSGLTIVNGDSMADAAQKIVKLVAA